MPHLKKYSPHTDVGAVATTTIAAIMTMTTAVAATAAAIDAVGRLKIQTISLSSLN